MKLLIINYLQHEDYCMVTLLTSNSSGFLESIKKIKIPSSVVTMPNTVITC